MTVPATSARAPLLLLVARGVAIAHAAVAVLVTGGVLIYAALAARDDAAARRAGHPNQFDGLGVGIGLLAAAVFGVAAIVLVAAAIGLCRSRRWGLVVAGVSEAFIAFAALRLALQSASIVAGAVGVSAAVVLVAVVEPRSRRWCRDRS